MSLGGARAHTLTVSGGRLLAENIADGRVGRPPQLNCPSDWNRIEMCTAWRTLFPRIDRFALRSGIVRPRYPRPRQRALFIRTGYHFVAWPRDNSIRANSIRCALHDRANKSGGKKKGRKKEGRKKRGTIFRNLTTFRFSIFRLWLYISILLIVDRTKDVRVAIFFYYIVPLYVNISYKF